MAHASSWSETQVRHTLVRGVSCTCTWNAEGHAQIAEIGSATHAFASTTTGATFNRAGSYMRQQLNAAGAYSPGAEPGAAAPSNPVSRKLHRQRAGLVPVVTGSIGQVTSAEHARSGIAYTAAGNNSAFPAQAQMSQTKLNISEAIFLRTASRPWIECSLSKRGG